MSSTVAKALADRFAADAETLRVRASARPSDAGPDADTSERMADACDRVSDLFASARDAQDASLEALIPLLERYQREEGDANVRAVYRGAIIRLRDARS